MAAEVQHTCLLPQAIYWLLAMRKRYHAVLQCPILPPGSGKSALWHCVDIVKANMDSREVYPLLFGFPSTNFHFREMTTTHGSFPICCAKQGTSNNSMCFTNKLNPGYYLPAWKRLLALRV